MTANFIKVNTTEELDGLFEKSSEQPVFLFKHSLTCPISAGVFQTVSDIESDVYLVVVQHAREVSNALAEKTGVRHESPQAIVLRYGKAVYHASHYDVTNGEIEELLSSESQENSANG